MTHDHSVGWRRDLDASTVDVSDPFETAAEVRVPGLTILCHPDPRRIGEVAALPELPAGRGVELSRLSPVFAAPDGSGAGRPLADPHLSRSPARLVPLRDTGWVRVDESPGGQRVELRPGGSPEVSPTQLEAGCVLQLGERVSLLLHDVDPTPPRGDDLGLVGQSPAIVATRDTLRRLARTDLPVLLRGETGTGKELAATALHRLSARRERPFVCVDMAALPPSLAAAELFGAAKGAFTGADRKRDGHFQRADGGSLFLDEIGDAPLEVQTSILRALETGEVAVVGGAPGRVDVRVIAATDADLEAGVRDGSFRAPLLHRLDGASVVIPPLRRRRCDVARLLLYFLRQELAKCDALGKLDPADKRQRPWLPADLMAELVLRPWPGNVRQLRNVARQMVVHFHDSGMVAPDADTLRLWGAGGEDWRAGAGSDPDEVEPAGPVGIAGSASRSLQPSQLSEDEVAAALEAHDWRIQPAARALGISRTSLYALIDDLPGLRRACHVGREEIEGALAETDGDIRSMVRRLKVSRHGLLRRMRELGLP